MCFDTSTILNLSLQGEQLRPILLISKWRSLPENTGIYTVLQDLKKRSRISEPWIWYTTQVLLAFFNPCQIVWCFSCILHFRGHHQCCVVWSCIIYELVTSTKLAFLSLQNSKCKYSPIPSEFQFKEPPLALGIPFQKTPPCPRNSKKPSVVVYGYFLELPNSWGTCYESLWLLSNGCTTWQPASANLMKSAHQSK